MSKQILAIINQMQSDIKALTAAGLHSNANHLKNVLAIVLHQTAANEGVI